VDGVPWECATVKVPLDYSDPGGRTIGIAVNRAKAKDKSTRIGSLLFNFGGPGASGVATLPQFGKEYGDLHSRYDLVSFDPRGVGESAPAKCLSDREMDESRKIDGTPDDAGEEKAALASQRKDAATCKARSGDLLAHFTTTDTARDLDVMRQVLGDDKLHYFGISYGTQLGGVYAHLFPKRVGHMLLDAVVDPTKGQVEASLGQAKGFQLALTNYMKDCARSAGCPTGQGGAAGTAKIAGLLKRLDAKPMDTMLGRKLNQSDGLTGIAAALYGKDNWPYLTKGLKSAMSGDGSLLLAFADIYMDRNENGQYSNSSAANRAINCADSSERFTAADVHQRLPEFTKASPVFGPLTAWGLLTCTDWPVKGQSKTPEVSATGSAPIVVVGNTGDPATPYEGARRMADGLGKGVGVEITYKGQGHGAYNGGNSCVKKAVDGYLLRDKVPHDGTTCS
jgi:pimeloyl-ACP methyl ester carboxylesterase